LDISAAAPDSREPNGRFAAGNPGGPGRSKGRGYELQRAAQDAITPEHIGALMRKALRMGLEGNLSAMRFVVERTCGKAPEAPTEAVALDISLPNLRTSEACMAAIDKLAAGVVAGTIDLATAKVLGDLVATKMKSIDLREYEKRIVELEQQAAMVQLPGANHRN
jgi:hypothetical protein